MTTEVLMPSRKTILGRGRLVVFLFSNLDPVGREEYNVKLLLRRFVPKGFPCCYGKATMKIGPRFDPETRAFIFSDLAPGPYHLFLFHEERLFMAHLVQAHACESTETFIVAENVEWDPKEACDLCRGDRPAAKLRLASERGVDTEHSNVFRIFWRPSVPLSSEGIVAQTKQEMQGILHEEGLETKYRHFVSMGRDGVEEVQVFSEESSSETLLSQIGPLRETELTQLEPMIHKLQASEDVLGVGWTALQEGLEPEVRIGPRAWTGRLYIRFHVQASKPEIDRLADGDPIIPLPFSSRLYCLELPVSKWPNVHKQAAALRKNPLVEFVEVATIGRSSPTSITDSHRTYSPSWAVEKVIPQEERLEIESKYGEEAAWGAPSIRIGVIDAFEEVRAEGMPPDLNGRLSDGRPKTTGLYEGLGLDQHGLKVAGLALGRTTGVAPNCSLVMVPHITPVVDQAWRMRGEAGFEGAQDSRRYAEGRSTIDIFVSTRIWGAETTPRTWLHLVEDLTTLGRGGKGCLLFVSADNRGDLGVDNRTTRGAVQPEQVIACGASTLNQDGVEVRARYSSAGKVDLCAPSGTEKVPKLASELGVRSVVKPGTGICGSDPVFSTRLRATAPRGAKVLQLEQVDGLTKGIYLLSDASETEVALFFEVDSVDTLSRSISIESSLEAELAAGCLLRAWAYRIGSVRRVSRMGCRRLHVTSTLGLKAGDHVLLGTSGPSGKAAACQRVLAVESPLELKVTPLRRDIAEGEQLFLATNHQSATFSGTSASTPICAGVAALVLSVNHRLNWLEVLDILQATAHKIDPWNGQWSTAEALMSAKSPFHGYGRVDGAAAVKMAARYDRKSRLVVRNSLTDKGLGPTEDPAKSPDIWLRRDVPRPSDAKNWTDDRVPHQRFQLGRPQWICVRVHNLGSQRSLKSWVRILLAAKHKDDAEPPEHPRGFMAGRETPNTTERPGLDPGTYELGVIGLPPIAANCSMVVSLPWSNEQHPAVSDAHAWFLMVDVTPHDGPLRGSTTQDNSCLARRKLDGSNRR